jgi:MFS family permease
VDANDRALTAFAMLGHATFHTYELVIPVFVAIWSDAFTASPALLGIIAGVSYGLVGVGALPSGVLADRVGSGRLVLVCLVGMGAAFGLVSVAPTLPVLAVALLLWGRPRASTTRPGWRCSAAGPRSTPARPTASPDS